MLQLLLMKTKQFCLKLFLSLILLKELNLLFKNSLLQMSKSVWKLLDITGFLYTLSLFLKTFLYTSLILFKLTLGVMGLKSVNVKRRGEIDSLIIADILRYGNFVETSLADENMRSLRELSRFRVYLVSSIRDLKRKVIALLDQVFPEYVLLLATFLVKLPLKFLNKFLLLKTLKKLLVINFLHC